jgi:hypothetical protein
MYIQCILILRSEQKSSSLLQLVTASQVHNINTALLLNAS